MKRQYIYISLFIVLVLILLFSKKVYSIIQPSETNSPKKPKCTIQYPLKIGSGYGDRWCENYNVMQLQEYLNTQWIMIFVADRGLIVDGKFGEKTEKSLYDLFGIKEVSKNYYLTNIAKK